MFYNVEDMKRETASTIGEFEQLILLTLLRLSDNAYGTTIHQELQKRTGREVSISAVYTTLDRLESKGFVRSHIGDPSPRRGGRRKKFYVLEPAGAEALSRSYRQYRDMIAGLERRLQKL